jgi:hypothetical protein
MPATKLYLHNVNTDPQCDGAHVPFDLARVVGSGGNANSEIASAAFVERMSFDANVPEDAVPGLTEFDVSLNVTLLSAATSYRFRVQAVGPSCAVVANSAYSATFNSTGVKTATLSLTWPQGASRLRLSLESKDDDSAGSKIVRVRADTSSYVVALFVPLLEAVFDAVVARLKGIARASGFHNTLLNESVYLLPAMRDQLTACPAVSVEAVIVAERGNAVLGDTARQRDGVIGIRLRCFVNVDDAQLRVVRLQGDVVKAVEMDPQRLGFSADHIEGLNVRVADPRETDDQLTKPEGIGDVIIEARARYARGRI